MGRRATVLILDIVDYWWTGLHLPIFGSGWAHVDYGIKETGILLSDVPSRKIGDYRHCRPTRVRATLVKEYATS